MQHVSILVVLMHKTQLKLKISVTSGHKGLWCDAFLDCLQDLSSLVVKWLRQLL